MRALVTGGGGFLGSGIAKSLHDKQHDVTVIKSATACNQSPHFIFLYEGNYSNARFALASKPLRFADKL